MTNLQSLVNLVANDGQPRRERTALIDARGPIDVPEGVCVEGGDRWLWVWRGDISEHPGERRDAARPAEARHVG